MIRRRMVVLFLVPALVLYLGLMILPAIQAFQLSFYATSGFGDDPVWVGLRNYTRLWGDPIFWRAVRNMLTVLVIGGAAVFGLAFLFTMLLSSGMWGKKFFRALIFLPNMIAVVAITTFWSFVFTPRYGLLTNLLKAMGLDGLAATPWTAPENVLSAMIVGLVWVSAGFFTILVLAGADKIPQDMFEAARLEGASTFQIFRYVTLPMIWDIVTIAVVLWSIQAIKLTEFPYAFGGPNIDQNLYTPAIYLYIMGFGQREPVYALGYASAIGVALFVFTLITIVGLRLLMKRDRLEY
ncbi:carbohydrate ABC transporter permease [Paracoccus sp. (in: a-proteobacteria)]|uniref:carbohydrate ABC transporter permease n=1 Tax=Paracoccus sp. TaxID=267 RepID=UPI0026DF3BD0|nr:sugar ABC transporter permease [Paracoccus sp. (in: a-proteobacteria)]MDO5646776.1 sugar ABC transporter permease [Paracoccus sp. (in: a-proteobacteria)]